VSLKLGPVLSHTLNLVKEKTADAYWAQHIRRVPGTYDVRLVCSPGSDELSDMEVELLGSVLDRFGKMTQFELKDLCHRFPEWQDPGGSSLPIDLDDIGSAPQALRESLELAALHRFIGAV
jgi:hypothetical protein